MCGIIGSSNLETFGYLFDQNKERGNFAYGTARVNLSSKVSIKKSDDFSKKPRFSSDTIMYLAHLQSPTSSKREFENNTTHPFRHGNRVLAHNGVLENFEKLKEENPELNVNEVDSSIILPLIEKYGLVEALQKLQGTFGCWMYDQETSELFLFRSGSTIYSDGINFSSKQPADDWSLLKEGVIYRFNFTHVRYDEYDTFQTSSGFFI